MLAYSFLVWLERRQRHQHTRQGRPRDPFPPRPKPRRLTLPAMHREVARWLRHQAVLWWMTTDRFIEFCALQPKPDGGSDRGLPAGPLLGRGNPDFGVMTASAVVVIALLLGGIVYFRQMERTFADVV